MCATPQGPGSPFSRMLPEGLGPALRMGRGLWGWRPWCLLDSSCLTAKVAKHMMLLCSGGNTLPVALHGHPLHGLLPFPPCTQVETPTPSPSVIQWGEGLPGEGACWSATPPPPGISLGGALPTQCTGDKLEFPVSHRCLI